MEPLLFGLLLAIGLQVATRFEQRERIALLASHLGRHNLERDMTQLLQDYLPALTEADPDRRAQRLGLLAQVESRLVGNLRAFSAAFNEVWGERTRVSRWPVAIPWATRLFPRASFDLRRAIAIHAEGVARAVANEDALGDKARAFRVTAELLLLQHSCHWFCRSRAVANARLLAHHQSTHEQVLASVGDLTRRDYAALVSG